MKVCAIPLGVTVVAVTKTFPPEVIAEAYALGYRHFGENYVQEFVNKYDSLPKQIRANAVWHMIGHVQSRKARDVVRLFDWVDSVDSIELAQKLHKNAHDMGKTLHVLLQVNITGEQRKSGFDLTNWENDTGKLSNFLLFIEQVVLRNLVVAGLMVMPPLVAHAEENRSVFQSAKRLFDLIKRRVSSPHWQHLSMGTSQDYRVAIEEGATMVRLGEAIFGKRAAKLPPGSIRGII